MSLGGHPGQGVADGDPLVQRGQHAEAEPVPQGGLPDQQRGERLTRSPCRGW